MPLTITPELMETLRQTALKAGEKIMEIYNSDFEVITKADDSPVTLADQAAEAIITPVLKEIWPDVPVVAEEAAAAGDIPDVGDGPFWLVDPVDGTKQFVSRKDEFTVNIALIEDRTPLLGVVYVPAYDHMYLGSPLGATFSEKGEEPKPIHVRKRPEESLVAVASISHRTQETDDFLEQVGATETTSAGSSLKFCLVAKGEADVYPRFGPTMEWDTGAGHAVLAAAGGKLINPDGSEFLYSKPNFRNGDFIAWGTEQ
ncbi:MAG: 3'(2'),5'-bisphosphate nucleotidase CysQ [Rhodospirillales bacterium]|nr:3'(2'),5'-bisphosphate nucleotidase CysQ [Rhodospirillales bacterium]